MRGTAGKETMLAAVKLETKVTAEDICYEGNYLCCCVFFTRTRYRIFILLCGYPTRLFSLHIHKGNERMGIRKIKEGVLKTKERVNGYPSGTHAGPSLLIQLDLLCFTSFLLVFFFLMLI
jgi:hypothetical protein